MAWLAIYTEKWADSSCKPVLERELFAGKGPTRLMTFLGTNAILWMAGLAGSTLSNPVLRCSWREENTEHIYLYRLLILLIVFIVIKLRME